MTGAHAEWIGMEMTGRSTDVRQDSTAAPLPADPGQAVALRRRWLRDPVVPLGHALEFAGCALWTRSRRCRAPGAWTRHRHRRDADRRDQYPDQAEEAHRRPR